MKILMFFSLLLLAACASEPKPRPVIIKGDYVQSQPTQPKTKTIVVPVPYAQPVPGQAVPLPKHEPSKQDIEKAKKQTPAQILDEANKKATQVVAPEGFVNAVQMYNYMEGALYMVRGAPNHLTIIEFGAHEQIIGFAAGDTVRWMVDQTIAGHGKTKRQVLVVQPTQRGLHTTLLVTTTYGVYRFSLKSYQHSYLAGVRFRYPRRRLMRMIQKQKAAHAQKQRAVQQASLKVNLAKIDASYGFVAKGGKLPSWAPRRVFHDGQKTFIEFAQPLSKSQAPALFLLSRTKRAQLTQHRIVDKYIIVPGVIDFAQLRLGKQSVGIEYRGKKR